MATEVFKGTFTANTSTGDQAVTGVGFQPAIVFFWTSKQTSAAWATGNYSLMFGWGVSSTKRGVCAISGDDAAGTSNTGRGERGSGCCLIFSDGAPTVDAVADFVSQDSDGFTINWSDAPASAWVIHYLAVGGTGVTAHAANVGSRTGTGTQGVTGYGGSPDVFFVMENLTSIDTTNSTNAVLGIGASAGTTSEGAVGVVDRDASATMVVGMQQRSDRVLVTSQPQNPPTLYHEAETSSLDADGFTLNFLTNVGSQPFHHCGVMGIDAAVVASSAPTANGTQSITGLAFAPAGFLAFSVNRATSTSLVTNEDLRLSVFGASKDGTNAEGGFVFTQDQGNTTSNYDRLHSTTRAIVHADIDQAITAEADVQSWNSDGITLDWVDTDATARETLFVFLGPAAASGTTYEDTGSATSAAAAAGADAFTATETGAATTGAAAAGVDVFEATDTGSAATASSAAAVDVFEATETGAATATASASGVATREKAVAGAATAGAAVSGADVAEFSETGAAAAAGAVSGVDVFEATETGAATAAAAASGVDAAVFTETGAAAADGVASGGAVVEKVKAGAAEAGAVASGADAAEFTETGAATTPAAAGGVDAFEAADTGTATTAAGVSGACVVEYGETGSAVTAASAAGTGVTGTTHAKTGGATAAAAASGVDVFEAADAGAGVAPAAVSGGRVVEYARAGSGVVGVDGSGPDAVELVRAGVVAAAGVASGVDALVLAEVGAGVAFLAASGTWVLVSGGTPVTAAFDPPTPALLVGGSPSAAGFDPPTPALLVGGSPSAAGFDPPTPVLEVL